MVDYKCEALEKAKSIVNGLDEDDVKRVTLEVDDSYDDETEITITVELSKAN